MVDIESRGARIAIAVIVALIILAGFAVSMNIIRGYAPPSYGAPQKEIKVGCIYYNSGPLADISKEIMNGLKLWEKQANERGIDVQGVTYGVKVVCKPAEPPTVSGVRNTVKTLISTDRVNILVGPPGNEPSKAAMTAAETAGIPLILTYQTDDGVFANGTAGQVSFQLMTPAHFTIKAMFDMFNYYNVTVKDVAVLYTVDPKWISRPYVDRLRSLALQYGVNLSFRAPITNEAGNITAAVQNLVNAGVSPDIVLLVVLTPDQIVTAVNSLKGAGLQSVKYIVVVAPTSSVLQAEQRLGEKMEGVIYASNWEPIAPISPFMAANLGYKWYGYTTSEQFVADYKAEYGAIPSEMAAIGYEAGLLIEYALTAGGSEDPLVILNTLRNSRLMTFYGITVFGGGVHSPGGYLGYQVGHPALFVEYTLSGGNLVKQVVWPVELATAPLK